MSVLFEPGQFAHDFIRDILNALLDLINLNNERLCCVSGKDRKEQVHQLQECMTTRVTGKVTTGSFCKYKRSLYFYVKATEIVPFSPEVGDPLAHSWYHFMVVESKDKCAYEIVVTKSSGIFENLFYCEILKEYATCLFHLVLEKE